MQKTACALLFLATITFAQGTPRPEVKTTLCQNWSAQLVPEGPTETFFSDNATVRLVVQSATPWPAGNTIKCVVATERDGQEVAILRGQDFVTNGKSNAWGTGFRIAGAPWAAQGGKFEFVLFWNDEQQPLAVVPFTVQAAKRWALLVGISDYPPAGRNAGDGDLPACDKDAERMRDLLVESFGFQPDNVRMVLNLEATSARLQKELIELADRAGPDDAVVFYYCGHGTQIPDLDGDETDGWDEALATADARPKLMTTSDQLAMVLSDDRIAELLARFKTRNVTVIFDSCHSGTAVRAGEENEEIDAEGFFLGMKREQGFGRKLVEQAEDADRSKATGVAAGLDIDERYVFLSAARSWETGMTDGIGCFFSAQLRDALRTADGRSWDAIIRQIRPAVQYRNPGQAPQADGAVRRYPFSLAESDVDVAYERPTVAAVGGWDEKLGRFTDSVNKGERVLVSGMASLYLESGGTEYEAYPAGVAAAGAQPRGRVRLTGKRELLKRPQGGPLAYATAEVIDGTVHRGDRLVPLMVRVPESTPMVGVVFLRSVTEAAKAQMAGAVNSMVGLLKSDSAVRLLTQGDASQLDYIVVPQVRDGKVYATVLTPTSVELGTVTGDANAIAKAVQELVTMRHATYARFNRISNGSPAFRLRVAADGGEGPRKAGTGLSCKGYVDRPAYLYAFFAVHGQAPQLAVASSLTLPPNEPFSFTIPINPEWKGRLLVKVIASQKPLDLGAINKAPPAERTAMLLKELQRVHPAPGGSSDFIGTQGWADDTVWYEFE